MKPLENLIVLEFCQFLAGPSAGLRLADLGARVIKIERPGTGDNGRKLAIKDLFEGENSLLFHTINRNKESYVANLKGEKDIEKVKRLIRKADVLIHNFRPGVMGKIGLDYEQVKAINPQLIYAVITGYGDQPPWKDKAGQDLLIQSLSGLTWLSGNREDPPVPFGISIADLMSGAHLTEGILAALIRRKNRNKGALIEVNLLASLMDFQFEVVTTYLNDGGKLPERAQNGNAHAYLSAPYGIYKTQEGYMVLAMGDLTYLGKVIGCDKILKFKDKESWFDHRDEIISILSEVLREKSTAEWLSELIPAGIWCADVFDYKKLVQHDAFQVLEMDQKIETKAGEITTTRCPIRIDGQRFFSDKRAPLLGEDNVIIDQEFGLVQ